MRTLSLKPLPNIALLKAFLKTREGLILVVGVVVCIFGITISKFYVTVETRKISVQGTQPAWEDRILHEGDLVIATPNSTDVVSGLIPFDRWVLLEQSGRLTANELTHRSNTTWRYETTVSFQVYETDRWVIWATGLWTNATGEANISYVKPFCKDYWHDFVFFGLGVIVSVILQSQDLSKKLKRNIRRKK